MSVTSSILAPRPPMTTPGATGRSASEDPCGRADRFSPFHTLLSSAQSAPAAPKEEIEKARAAATQFVASAFVLPVLETLRNSPFAPTTGPFAPGTAEKRFGPLLDQHFADAVTKGAQFNLVDTIMKRFAKDGISQVPTPPGREVLDARA
jgi:hypothetical protein